jgi:hypothetical protein
VTTDETLAEPGREEQGEELTSDFIYNHLARILLAKQFDSTRRCPEANQQQHPTDAEAQILRPVGVLDELTGEKEDDADERPGRSRRDRRISASQAHRHDERERIKRSPLRSLMRWNPRKT